MVKNRNDAMLYGGSNSQTPLEYQQELREKRKEAKEAAKREIGDNEAEVLKAVDAEKDATVKQILNMVSINATKTQVKETLVALNLYEQSLIKLKSKLQNVLRTPHE